MKAIEAIDIAMVFPPSSLTDNPSGTNDKPPKIAAIRRIENTDFPIADVIAFNIQIERGG